MNLSSFPSDVIDVILQPRGTSYLAIRLWKCGDRLLNYKLANGLTSIDLKDCHLMPQVLSRFSHLRSASLNTRYNPLYGYLTGDALPKSIHSLELTCINTSSAGWCQPAVDFPHLLPQLSSLTIIVEDSYGFTPLLKKLPETLTHLRIAPRNVSLSCLSDMPRSLRILDAELALGLNTASTLLTDASYADHVARMFSDIPPSLEILSAVNVSCNRSDDHDDTPWTAHLPHCIQTLILRSSISYGLLATLPRSLTALILVRSDIDWSVLAKSPASSALDHNGVIKAENYFWPPSLQLLAVKVVALDRGVLLALPRTLKKLNLTFSKEGNTGTLFVDELPLGLERLRLEHDTLNRKLLTIVGEFPSSLHLLRCMCMLQKLLVEQWAPHSNRMLPRSLTSLDIARLDIHLFFEHEEAEVRFLRECTFRDLPTSLTSLRVVGLLNSRFALLRPAELHLTLLEKLSLPTDLYAPATIARHLPRSLTSLFINISLSWSDPLETKDSAAELERLPPNLTACGLGDSVELIISAKKTFSAIPKRARAQRTSTSDEFLSRF